MLNTHHYAEFIEKRLSEITMMDDAFMTAVLSDNIPGTEVIVRTILNKPDLRIIHQHVQHRLQNLHAHSSIFDVLAADSEGVLYDIEIQNASNGASARRARYYSAMIDCNALSDGSDFNALKESYVIFIAKNDVLKEGLPLYHINRMIEETGNAYNDGAHIIIVNGAYEDSSSELGKLIFDLQSPNPAKMHFTELSGKAGRLKDAKEGVPIMSQFWEDIFNEAKAEGLEQGRAEGRAEGIAEGHAAGILEGATAGFGEGEFAARVESVTAIMKNLGMDLEEAMEALGIPSATRDLIRAHISAE